jgi:hypothetical protein
VVRGIVLAPGERSSVEGKPFDQEQSRRFFWNRVSRTRIFHRENTPSLSPVILALSIFILYDLFYMVDADKKID